MQKQQNTLCVPKPSLSLNQVLLKTMRQHPPHQSLEKLLIILSQLSATGNESTRQLQRIINRLCDQVLNLNDRLIKVDDFRKEEQVEILFKNFVSVQHYKEILFNHASEPTLIKYREIISQYFHFLIHHTTIKNLTKLCVLFYKFVSLQMLERKIVNFFFLTLILSHENLNLSNDIKYIKMCLRSLYKNSVLYVKPSLDQTPRLKKKGQQPYPINYHLYDKIKQSSLSFSLIAYIIFFGNVSSSKCTQQMKQDQQMLEDIISKPYNIVSIIQQFRNQFPKNQVYNCTRDLESVSESIIDSYFLKSLFGIYLDYRLNPVHKQQVYEIIQNLIKFNLTLHTVKSLIKKLEITDNQNYQQKWKNVFVLLKTTFPNHNKITKKYRESIQISAQQLQSEESIRFTDLPWTKGVNINLNTQSQNKKIIIQKNVLKFTYFSHLSYNLEHEFNGFFITFKSYRILDQYILLKLKNDQNQIWVTVRHIDQTQFQLSIIKFMNSTPTEMTKAEIDWDPFEKHVLQCSLQDDYIVFKFGTQQISLQQALTEQDLSPTEKQINQTLKMKNIRPKQIILGANSNDLPNYLTQITNFQIKYCQGKITYNFILHNKYKINKISTNVKMVPMQSLSLILKKLGEIDLFFLITSHLIRKVDNDQSLKKMLKQVNDFLQYLVVFKGVSGLRFNQELRQLRFYNVRCLIWLASKYKKDPQIILQILRLLQIRKIKRPIQILQILSNIGLWKQIPSKSHIIIIQKIKQHCKEAATQKSSQMIQQIKKIILDFTLFYKDSQIFSENLQQEYLQKHSQILKLIYDVVSNLKISGILDFIIFQLKILFIVLDKTKNNDYIDSTIGFQLVMLVHRLLYTARQAQFGLGLKEKNKSPGKKSLKMSKLFTLASSRSMNIPLKFAQNDKDDESYTLKIEQILAWIHEIIFILNSQILQSQQKIKFFDWDWDYKSITKSTVFLPQSKGQYVQKSKVISETKILTYCQYIEVGLMSFNKNIFNDLVTTQLSDQQWQIYWNMNLFDEKVSAERFLDTLKVGNFQKIIWSDEKVISVLIKSFDLSEGDSSIKLPSKLLQSMKIKDITNIHNTLLGVYLQKSQKNNPIQRQKCAQKIMFLIALIPDSLYSNTQLLRQQIRKQKRNLKTVELIQKHLIVKQLAKEGFKLVNQMKLNINADLTSTIFAFDDKNNQRRDLKQSATIIYKNQKSTDQLSSSQNIKMQNSIAVSSPVKNVKSSQQLNVFKELQSIEYQQSFLQISKTDVISTQKIKESLQHYKLLATPNQMQEFYKILSTNQNKKEAQEEIQGRITNFNIIQQPGSVNEKINQLQNFIFFIQKHIYAFSKMILTQHMFTLVNSQAQQLRARRKKSFKASNYKFKEQSESLLDQFFKDRRKSVYRMENIWTSVQKNNKDFWQVFFKSQKKNQCVDQICNSMKLKGLIKINHQKRQIQLPKNMASISNKFSVSGDSDKQLQPEGISDASIFGDLSVYQQQQSFQREKEDNISKQNTPLNSKEIQGLKKQQKKSNQFSVLYITTTKIYQGLIICGNSSIHFIEDKTPDDGFYQIICANEHERRAANQIQKKKEEFQITLNDRSSIIPKRYLYYDAAVEIYSQRRAYFFVFRKSVKREQFLCLLQHIKGAILNEDQLLQAASKQTQRWMNGDISNYTYLMHLNDLSGRSFNDMSQYYIFPWIITNFKSQKFNKKFISNQNNYRDLSKPIGALNQKRLNQLLARYGESMKYQDMESYLYGSFCSNPAIVCNYLVRLQPFSMFHYLLQSKQFDLADRIFYSISNQFTCCYSNVGDYKQLIPQFFSSPEFLRNRNKYKFGHKQNKQIVNNVQLPEWALHQFGSTKNSKMADKLQSIQPQQQFVFRMRKCLQSAYVTSNLNKWIDLMFGPYNQKQRAMQRNNLYIESLYKNQLSKNKNNKNKQTCLIFFKQFGQMPRDLFDKDHKEYKAARAYYKIGNSYIQSIAQLSNQNKVRKNYYADHRFIIYWDQSNINIINIKNKSGLLQKTQYGLSQTPIIGQISELKSFSVENHSEDKKNDVKIDLLIYLKEGKVMVREIGVTTFRKKLQIKQQKQCPQILDNKFHILELNQEQKLILLVYYNTIRVYSYSLQVNNVEKSGDLTILLGANHNFSSQQCISIPLNKKLEFKLNQRFQFAQHRSKISHMKYSKSYGIVISIDNNRKVFISKLNCKQLEVLQYFRLKRLTNCETILQMQVHQMGYIYILTSLNIIHMYNLMGDYVGGFSGITLREINKKMQSKIDSKIQLNKSQFQPKTSLLINRQEKAPRKKSGNQIQVGNKFITFEMQSQQSQIQTGVAQEQKSQNRSRRGSFMDDLFSQQITTFQIWSHQSGQIIIGTNLNNSYRLDMFMVDDCEKVNLSNYLSKDKNKRKKSADKTQKNNLEVQFINVKRIGRHWQCWVASSEELLKIQSQDYRNAEKRNEEYHKKYVLD